MENTHDFGVLLASRHPLIFVAAHNEERFLDGFSGAEIETVVVGALYRAVGEQVTLDTTVLLAEIASTVPLSVSRREEIAALRHWAEQRAHAA